MMITADFCCCNFKLLTVHFEIIGSHALNYSFWIKLSIENGATSAEIRGEEGGREEGADSTNSENHQPYKSLHPIVSSALQYTVLHFKIN